MNAILALGPFGAMELLVIAVLFGVPVTIVAVVLFFVMRGRQSKSPPPPLPGRPPGE